MSTQRQLFSVPTEEFNVALLPSEARQPGSPAFKSAATSFLQTSFRELGGRVSVEVANGRVCMAWDSARAARRPIDVVVPMLQRGSLVEGIQLLEFLVSAQPRNPALWYNLGVAMSDTGRFVEAEARLRRAVELLPKYTKAHIALAVALSRQGKHREASEAARVAAALEPRNPLARRNLGTLLCKDGHYDEAVDHLKAALELEDKHQDAWVDLGDALRKTGRGEEARIAYQRAIALDPESMLAARARAAAGWPGKLLALFGK